MLLFYGIRDFNHGVTHIEIELPISHGYIPMAHKMESEMLSVVMMIEGILVKYEPHTSRGLVLQINYMLSIDSWS